MDLSDGHDRVLRAECCHSDPEHVLMHLECLGQLALVIQYTSNIVLQKRMHFLKKSVSNLRYLSVGHVRVVVADQADNDLKCLSMHLQTL